LADARGGGIGLESAAGPVDTPTTHPVAKGTIAMPDPLALNAIDPATLVRPRRTILGMSAVLLPFRADGSIDRDGFAANVARTAAAGIVPAVNMDTGYVHLLDDTQRRELLTLARETLGDSHDQPFGGLVAGACVVDEPGAGFDEAGYARQLEMITAVGGTPVIFPSFGLAAGGDAGVIAGYRAIARRVPRFIGFELSTEFVASGRLLTLESYADLLAIPECAGAKHSSLSRRLEWQRLALRNRLRPDFHVFTGNDLAIDMVRYGSDWLLGLSTAWPEAFACRDRWWAEGDDRFDELDDALQALGDFAFRDPVPAYKHSMAQTLALRGLLACDEPHPNGLRRPESDRPILETIIARIERALEA
jgi:dihydrodipicolinate synthase/N-acetylneuraminate lyase